MPGRYRRTPTPGGLEEIERGSLRPYDLETYANLNTGVLEEYLEERGRGPAFAATRWSWRLALAATVVGAAFAAVNVYVGLKTGVLVAGAWYVAFLLAVAGRERGAGTSLVTGAALAGGAAAAGVALFLPALFLLALPLPGSPTPLAAADLPSWGVASAAVVAGGLLALALVAYLRRLFLVDDPVPFPGAEPFVRLTEMAEAAGTKASGRAGHGLRLAAVGAFVGAAWATLRDAPLLRGAGDAATVVGSLLGRFGTGGTLGQPLATARWTWLGLGLSPLLAAVGWFLRLRGALLVFAGAAFAWLVAVPLAVALDLRAAAPGFEGVLRLSRWWDLGQPIAVLAHAGPVRWLAAGALVGAGLALLLRHGGAVAHGLTLLGRAPGEAGRRTHVPARGAWEMRPAGAVALAIAGVLALASAAAAAAGPPGWTLALVGLVVLVPLVVVGLVLLGESGLEPLSGAGALVLLLAYAGAFLAGAGTRGALLVAFVAAAAYATCAAVAAAVLLSQKVGLYAGARPALGFAASAPAIAVGALVAAAVSLALVPAMAPAGTPVGAGDLAAPHASAFAAVGRLMAGAADGVAFFLVGLLVGVAAELVLAGGGAFAIGMLLPFGFAAAIAVGGIARGWWENRWLPRRAEKLAWDPEKRAVAVLDTYLLAVGLIVGEAAIGIALVLL